MPIPVNLKPGQCRPCKMHVIGVGSIFAEKRTDTNNTPPRSRLEFPLGFSEAAPSMSSPKSSPAGQIRCREPLCCALGADKLSEAVFLVPGTPPVTNRYFPAE